MKKSITHIVPKIIALSYVLFALPLVSQAGGGVKKVLGEAGDLIEGLIPLVIGLGVLVFLWGVLTYVIAADDAGKAKGRSYMLWGIIALFVMISVWGLVNLIQSTFSLNNTTPTAPPVPRVGVE